MQSFVSSIHKKARSRQSTVLPKLQKSAGQDQLRLDVIITGAHAVNMAGGFLVLLRLFIPNLKFLVLESAP